MEIRTTMKGYLPGFGRGVNGELAGDGRSDGGGVLRFR